MKNLRDGKIRFVFDIIDNKTPTTKDNSFTWFMNQDLKSGKQDLDHVFSYLDSIGFDIEKNYIESDDLKTLEYCFDAAYRNWLPSTDIYCFTDLFKISSDLLTDYSNKDVDNPTFDITQYFNGWNIGKFKATDLLISFINKQGCIYAINNWNIYFEIITPKNSDISYLYYKYQTIIGGRRLCKVSFKKG